MQRVAQDSRLVARGGRVGGLDDGRPPIRQLDLESPGSVREPDAHVPQATVFAMSFDIERNRWSAGSACS
jgi:hypothetical protein